MKYTIEVQLGADKYKSMGETALEALQALGKPIKIFTKGVVTFTHGKSKRTLVLMPQKLKRLWWKNAQPILAKDFTKGLLGVKQ